MTMDHITAARLRAHAAAMALADAFRSLARSRAALDKLAKVLP